MARATAEMLVREGARVAILDREASQGEQAAAAMGGGTRFHPCDVMDFAGTEAAIKRVEWSLRAFLVAALIRNHLSNALCQVLQ